MSEFAGGFLSAACFLMLCFDACLVFIILGLKKDIARIDEEIENMAKNKENEYIDNYRNSKGLLSGKKQK
jgi:hypothetical protein